MLNSIINKRTLKIFTYLVLFILSCNFILADFAYGNEIDGTIAAVKRLVSKKTYFFNNLEKEKSVLLDDAEAYAVSSFMHTATNLQDYNKNNNNFASIVNKVLNDQTYEQLIYYVEEPGSNTQLRIKHVNPLVGSNLVSASGDNPVVLSQGIHSNLESWEGFGKDIADNEHRDVWRLRT